MQINIKGFEKAGSIMNDYLSHWKLGTSFVGVAVLFTVAVLSALAAGTITLFPLPTASTFARSITAGPDGALWFTEVDIIGRIGRIPTDPPAI